MNLLRWIVGKKGNPGVRRNTYNLVAANFPPICNWSHWRVTGVKDVPSFCRALPSLVPDGSILCLAMGAWPVRVQNILDSLSLNMESARNVILGLDFAEAYYISITQENMIKLADLSEHSADVEIAVHLAVLFEDERVLEWFDLPEDPIFIDETIGEESVSRFAASMGVEYQKIIFCDDRTFIDV